MRLTHLSSVGKTVVLTAVVASVLSFIIGLVTMMLMHGREMNFIVAAGAAVGIVLACAFLFAIMIVLVSVLFVHLKCWYDDWYRQSGFGKDLQKLVKRGLVNPAHVKSMKKSSPKKKSTPTKKKTTTTSKKSPKKASKK